jgi:hypothetical protein
MDPMDQVNRKKLIRTPFIKYAPAIAKNESCKKCKYAFCSYNNGHVAHECQMKGFLLGTPDQFCEAFYHIFKNPELKSDTHVCIPGKETKCRAQCPAMVARLQDSKGKDICLIRYTNCYLEHSELFFSKDPLLLKHIEQHDIAKITLMMKYQPCHHSGGNSTRYPEGYLFDGQCDARSCTLILIQFYIDHLKPRKIELIVKPCGIYKAHWEFAEREDDKVTVANAREGIHLLMKAGIKICCVHPSDWEFLSRFITTQPNLYKEQRLQLDYNIQLFLDKQHKKLLIEHCDET